MANESAKDTPTRARVILRKLGKGLLYFAGFVAVVATFFVVMGWNAFGKGPAGKRLERMHASPQWDGDKFENPLPLWNDPWRSITGFFNERSPHGSPEAPLPVVRPEPSMFDTPPEGGVRVTWLGHSTLLIEVDGVRFLTDPVWGERTSPYSWLGPSRWYPPPIALDDLPSIDAVLISHDHYDHLDAPTIEQIKGWDTRFITPLGVGAHLAYWGVDESRITEMDWWENAEVGEITVACVPARHASGRQVLDQGRTLWAGYALVGPRHRLYFSGDTGMFPELARIGADYGPFDLTMIEVGAYHQAWPDWHMGPEQAVEAHAMVGGKAFIPIHWGLFDLALHGWTAPIERTMVAAESADANVIVPRPGESVTPESKTERWWPDVPWQTAEEHPIRATGLDG